MGTADGARIGVSVVIFVSGDCETMALYLGSRDAKRKGGRICDETHLDPRRSRRTPDPSPPALVATKSIHHIAKAERPRRYGSRRSPRQPCCEISNTRLCHRVEAP